MHPGFSMASPRQELLQAAARMAAFSSGQEGRLQGRAGGGGRVRPGEALHRGVEPGKAGLLDSRGELGAGAVALSGFREHEHAVASLDEIGDGFIQGPEGAQVQDGDIQSAWPPGPRAAGRRR